ncbi:MAG: hypothetical protein ACJAV5_001950 [Vicingaceae bacterium]|jgi:hypothetical protein
MIPKKGITLLLLILPFSSFSQYVEKIVCGRPGQANGPFAAGKRVFQVQTGFRLQVLIHLKACHSPFFKGKELRFVLIFLSSATICN